MECREHGHSENELTTDKKMDEKNAKLIEVLEATRSGNTRRTREARDPTAANDRAANLAGGTNRATERGWYVGLVADGDAAVAFLSDIEVAAAVIGITLRLT